jgi:hypothetical protein
MAKYLVLNPTFLDQPGTSCGPRIYGVGEVVRYDGLPGIALFPLDGPARSARRKALAQRYPDQRARDELWIKRYRRGLTGPTLARFEQARAEWEAEHV